jgi:hypothetical protein
MTVPIPICAQCKFFNHESWTCDAFKNGIPSEIIDGSNNHAKPLPNQGNDIVFTKKEDDDQQ